MIILFNKEEHKRHVSAVEQGWMVLRV